jgi:spore germination protein KB
MFQEKIANRQLFNIFFIMRTTIVISILPVLTIGQARQDAWLAAVITFFLSAVFIWLLGRLALNFPDQSIIQYSKELLGKWPGGLLSLFFLSAFLLMGFTDLRVYSEVLRTVFLPETPLIVVLGSMVFIAVVVCYAGLEPLGRMADLIFPVFTLAVLFTLLFPILEADFSNLRPVLYHGWRPVLHAALTPTGIAAQYANLALLVPSVNQPRKALQAALNSLLGASIILALAAVVVVALLGAEEGAHAAFPVFKMIRAIRLSEFLERIEIVTIFPWGLGLFVTLAVNLYSLAKGLAQLCRLQDYRPLLLPLAVIISTLALQGYSDSFELRQFFQPQVIAPFLFFVLLFPVAILWIAYFFRRKKGLGLTKEKRRGR